MNVVNLQTQGKRTKPKQNPHWKKNPYINIKHTTVSMLETQEREKSVNATDTQGDKGKTTGRPLIKDQGKQRAAS